MQERYSMKLTCVKKVKEISFEINYALFGRVWMPQIFQIEREDFLSLNNYCLLVVETITLYME